ncbi:MAG TPA: hypothetical protein VLX91_11360 [Candidatus Acidoferrales bacterium]|nr:hypothetical protein [Candidatus Acidoferrales bacterium]
MKKVDLTMKWARDKDGGSNSSFISAGTVFTGREPTNQEEA